MGKMQSWLLKIHRKNGVIIPGPKNAELFPIYRNGDRRRRPIAWLKPSDFKSYLADGFLEEHHGEYRIADSLIRRIGGGGFAAQHRTLEKREIYDPHGEKSNARVNAGGDVFSRLCRLKDAQGRAFLSPDEIEAGNRFLSDYTRSGMGRVQTQQFDQLRVDTHGSENAAEAHSNRSIDARNRVMKALNALGPGLDKAIISICVHNGLVGSVEKNMGWARGSGKTVVKLALGRLSQFYGCQTGLAYSADFAN